MIFTTPDSVVGIEILPIPLIFHQSIVLAGAIFRDFSMCVPSKSSADFNQIDGK